MTFQVLSPRDIQTTLNYFSPLDDQPPYKYAYEPPPHVAKSNLGHDSRAVVIHDVRGKDTPGLDITGFQFLNYPSVEKEFNDQDKIKTVYYVEVAEMLKKHTGAKRVHIFNHIITFPSKGLPRPRTKAHWYVHVDHTWASASLPVEIHLRYYFSAAIRTREVPFLVGRKLTCEALPSIRHPPI